MEEKAFAIPLVNDSETELKDHFSGSADQSVSKAALFRVGRGQQQPKGCLIWGQKLHPH